MKMFPIKCLSDKEQKKHDRIAHIVLRSSPFILSPHKIGKANIDFQTVKQYFNNNFFDEDAPVSLMPFTILLDRLSRDNEDELYEKICYYVFDQVKYDEYDLALFVDIMTNRPERMPYKITKYLKFLNKNELYDKVKDADTRYAFRNLIDYAFIGKKIENNYGVYDKQENISYILNEFVACTLLAVSSAKLEDWGISKDDKFGSWFFKNFSNESVLFPLIIERMYYAEDKFLEYRRLLNLVERSIIRSKSRRYAALYVIMTDLCKWYDKSYFQYNEIAYYARDLLKMF